MWKGCIAVVACGLWFAANGTLDGGSPTAEEAQVRAAMADAARLRLRTSEETKKARNKSLAAAFDRFRDASGGQTTAEVVRGFAALLAEHGLTSFDDFQQAEMTPRRDVKDPASGDLVPVFGPLGSDLINPWLADMEIHDGKPVDRQPAYLCAKNALCEHVDFVLIGQRDPNLSFDALPEKLKVNARIVYARLNPTNRFDGGFDQPLYYATVRLAAKKLFREDYPQAKLTMAQLVVAEERGGFGIRSCLLCHEGSHAGVYRRLLGQALYLEAKSQEAAGGGADQTRLAADARNYQEAAAHVLQAHGDKFDAQQVRSSLVANKADNIERLKPGYQDFAAVLDKLGCLKCHSTNGSPPPNKDPREHGAWALEPSTYYKTENIQALLSNIDAANLEKSPLLLKAKGEQDHEGVETVKLNTQDADKLQRALAEWLHSL